MGSGSPSSTPVRSLRRANVEPGREVIAGVVSVLHAVVAPLTRRDWRRTELIPQTGGVVFVVNHISNADPLAVGQFLAFSGRWPRFLAKASLFRFPVLGRLLVGCGQIPVQRGSRASGQALEAAEQAVRDGRAVVVYPEGTITRDPGLWPMRGKTGAARIALASGVPVVPIGQWGAQEILYGHQLGVPKVLPRKTLRLVVGPPVGLDDLRTEPLTAALLDEATTRIMDAITGLVAELRGEDPPAIRFDPRAAAPPGPV